MKVRNAQKRDARSLAYLINLAGEGIPYYLWSSMGSPEQDPLVTGAERAAREEGGFSYKNARVVDGPHGILGMIVSYKLDDPYEVGNLEDIPKPVRPLIMLESKVPGSWYINAVATMESARGQGIATGLLRDAEKIGLANRAESTSLIVASENRKAKILYFNLGYKLTDALPVVDCEGLAHGGSWELMVKTFRIGSNDKHKQAEK